MQSRQTAYNQNPVTTLKGREPDSSRDSAREMGATHSLIVTADKIPSHNYGNVVESKHRASNEDL